LFHVKSNAVLTARRPQRGGQVASKLAVDALRSVLRHVAGRPQLHLTLVLGSLVVGELAAQLLLVLGPPGAFEVPVDHEPLLRLGRAPRFAPNQYLVTRSKVNAIALGSD